MLAENAMLRMVLFDVMENAHPAKYAIAGDTNDDVSPTRAAIELGLTRGYSKYGDTLRLLSVPVVKAAAVGESTYESTQPEQQNA